MIGEDIFERFALFVGINRPGIKALFSDWLAAGDCQFSHRRFSLRAWLIRYRNLNSALHLLNNSRDARQLPSAAEAAI
jgi:hypothetical protein